MTLLRACSSLASSPYTESTAVGGSRTLVTKAFERSNSASGLVCASRVLRAPVYCRVVDISREGGMAVGGPNSGMPPQMGYTVKVDLGEGVTEMQSHEFQTLVDSKFRSHSRFGTVKSGIVTNRFGKQVQVVRAFEKYIVTGNLRGGYIRDDPKFGYQLTGFNGGTIKPSIKWAGDEL